MAGFINLLDFEPLGDTVSISISSTVDLAADNRFSGWPKLLIQAAGGDARFSFSDEDPSTTLHILKADDTVLVRWTERMKFRGTTLLVTPGR